MNDFKMKIANGQLGKNLVRVIPMIEEITKEKMLPICLFGLSVNRSKNKIRAHYSTISNDERTEAALIQLCEQLLISKGYLITEPPTKQ